MTDKLHHLRAAQFDYTNHAGRHERRTVIPQRMWFGISDFHPTRGEHWFLYGYCLDRKAYRDFLWEDVSRWQDRQLPPGTTVPADLK